MAEAIGGAILTSLIKVLVKTLVSPEAANFFRSNCRLQNQLEVKLRSANSLLNDAEDKQVRNEIVKNWVDDLSQVLNDAENAFDKVNTKVLCREIERKKLCVPASLNPFDQWAIKGKFEEITRRLELLLGEAENLGLSANVPSKRLSRSPAPLIEDPSHVYGRYADKDAILDLLFAEKSDGQDKISVIPIVGMGGVGKTTLARLVYNDSRVKDHFEHRAWVTASDDFDVLNLAKRAIEGLSGKESKVAELGELGEELEKFLSGKKFFLALDDVWNDNYNPWNSLKSVFQVGANGSKIIVTTRSQRIGSMMGNVSSHSLRPMEDEDSWKLFQNHAFCSAEECTKKLETIGREIVKKCKGLPLAVVSLAGLLRRVSDPKEWEKVEKSDVWKDNDEILPSLWLSYSYLPSNVKRCFAYCSIFPKNYEYDKDKMVLLWMAEGLVQVQQEHDMEDVGEEYFSTLVSRSLLERSATDPSSFVMHDLVHDVATLVLGKDICMRLGKGNGSDCLTSKTRHLLCHYIDVTKGLSRASSLHTFISNCGIIEVPNKLRCLRVLSRLSINKVPDSIGKLKHLRYLDLSKSEIERLPDKICKLYNLQTLLLRGCVFLTQLPTKMDKLINLRHLDISETPRLKEIPPRIAKMKDLRTITKFELGSGITIRELKKFPHLCGCLNICGLENIVDANDVLEAELKERSLVTELILEWSWYRNVDAAKDRAILDAFQPHPNLKKLTIKSFGGNEFSSWVADHSFSKVTEVFLKDGKHCFQLPSLGQLPALKMLKLYELHGIKKIGSEFYGTSGATPFPRLKVLEIKFMGKLQSWSIKAQGAFPLLEELTLEVCPMLNAICLDSSRCLPSLKTLSIKDCPKTRIPWIAVALEFEGIDNWMLSIGDLATHSMESPSSHNVEYGRVRKCRFVSGGGAASDHSDSSGDLEVFESEIP